MDNITIGNISPITEFFNHSEVNNLPEPNDVKIILSSSLDKIKFLDNKPNNNINEQQTEKVTNSNGENGSNIDKNQPIEILKKKDSSENISSILEENHSARLLFKNVYKPLLIF